MADVIQVADQVNEYLNVLWDIESVREKCLMSLAKYGPTFCYTPFISDPSLYGSDKIGVYSSKTVAADARWICQSCGEETPATEVAPEVPVCPHCTAPLDPEFFVEPSIEQEFEQVEVETPLGTTEIHVASLLNVVVPKEATSLESAAWLWYKQDVPKGDVKRMLAKVGEKMKEASYTAEGDFDRLIRERIMSITPNIWNSVNTVTASVERFWLKPGMYWLIDGDNNEDLRLELEAQFPRGLKITRVNREIVALEEERVTDVWDYTQTSESGYIQSSQALFQPYLEAQDQINDMWNSAEAVIASAGGVTTYDTSKIDKGVIENSMGRAGRMFIPVLGDPRHATYDLAPTQPNSALYVGMERVLQTARDILGITPAMWGGGSFSTAKEAQLALEQALQVFAPLYNRLALLLGHAKRNAAFQLAQFSGGILPLPEGRSEPIRIPNISVLLKGGWKYDFDPTIASSTAAIRDRLSEMFNNPAMAEFVGFKHPSNLRRAHEILGFTGMYIPGEDDARYANREIERIVNGEEPRPLPPGIINMDVASQTVATWLKSEEGLALFENEPEVWDRVMQFWQSLQPPPPPPPPGPGPMEGPGEMEGMEEGEEEGPPPGLGSPEAPPLSGNPDEGLDPTPPM